MLMLRGDSDGAGCRHPATCRSTIHDTILPMRVWPARAHAALGTATSAGIAPRPQSLRCKRVSRVSGASAFARPSSSTSSCRSSGGDRFPKQSMSSCVGDQTEVSRTPCHKSIEPGSPAPTADSRLACLPAVPRRTQKPAPLCSWTPRTSRRGRPLSACGWKLAPAHTASLRSACSAVAAAGSPPLSACNSTCRVQRALFGVGRWAVPTFGMQLRASEVSALG